MIVPLHEVVRELVQDGDTVALEGFTHLIPVVAGHEIIRQELRDLTLVRMAPDIVYDQLIGAGCARKLVFSRGGNPGSLHRFRDAVTHGRPHPLEIEEHSHAGMVNRYVAGASGLPFAVLRGYSGTDLIAHSANTKTISCPFTEQELAAVPALDPDVAVVHAQRADHEGNVQLWGITGLQKEAALAAERALVTVEEVVKTLEPVPGQVILPSRVIDAVSPAPEALPPPAPTAATSVTTPLTRPGTRPAVMVRPSPPGRQGSPAPIPPPNLGWNTVEHRDLDLRRDHDRHRGAFAVGPHVVLRGDRTAQYRRERGPVYPRPGAVDDLRVGHTRNGSRAPAVVHQ